MKILELFAGTRSIGKAFESKGHEVFSVELDKQHTGISLYSDILDVTPEYIIEHFGFPDVIWASPPCTTYSIAGISHHRRRNADTGELEAFSDYAHISDKLVKHTQYLIDSLSPSYWFIENPRGGLRKMSFMQDKPRYTLTYCQYGSNTMKPTDIWTNHKSPSFKQMCKRGAPCHESAPRGSKSGLQGVKSAVLRSVIPSDLCFHIADICERGLNHEYDEGADVLPQTTQR